MKYAVSNGGRSWRAISDDMPLLEGETLSLTLPPDPPPLPPTAAQLRHDGAFAQALLADHLYNVAIEQALSYIDAQITNGVTIQQATTALTNANSLNLVKPIVQNLINSLYAANAIIQLEARLLIALRDHDFPTLPDP
jgi:hypothetical protein